MLKPLKLGRAELIKMPAIKRLWIFRNRIECGRKTPSGATFFENFDLPRAQGESRNLDSPCWCGAQRRWRAPAVALGGAWTAKFRQSGPRLCGRRA
jgi:hypothetical protein